MSYYFDMLSAHMPTVAYNISTMERIDSPQTGRVLAGLVIASLLGEIKEIEWPDCIESPLIPEAYGEVASPEDVHRIPKLRHLKDKFPEKDPSWGTLLLIGRTCGKAMLGKEQVMGEPYGPHAVETPLGWALIGCMEEREGYPKTGSCLKTVLREWSFKAELEGPAPT